MFTFTKEQEIEIEELLLKNHISVALRRVIDYSQAGLKTSKKYLDDFAEKLGVKLDEKEIEKAVSIMQEVLEAEEPFIIPEEQKVDIKPSSTQEAFSILNYQEEGVPFLAIEYLQNCNTDEEILDAIIFALNNTYKENAQGLTEDSALWYAVVAEKFLDKRLISPVIQLFTVTKYTDDMLCEQGSILIAMLAEKFGDIVVSKVYQSIEENKNKEYFPLSYLFDAFYYSDLSIYKKKLLNWFKNENFPCRDILVYLIADFQIVEAIPIIEAIVEREYVDIDTREWKEMLKFLKNEKSDYIKTEAYLKTRGHWKNHFARNEHCFYNFEDDIEDEDENNEFFDYDDIKNLKMQPEYVEKIGRNDQCPCGSGKKYKKCCLS